MGPQRIGRYRILREVGRGAMGVVYLAEDPALRRQVAIKTITLGQGLPAREREEARRRFLREARAAAGLLHPNIVLVLDVGAEAGDLFIAMEYIQGPTLEEFTRTPDLLPPERAVQYVAEACDALEVAHRRQIIHRDLKPANLMAADGHRLKITDFGLAKDPSTSLTHTGTLVGTPSYMSPEQIQGRDLDGRSDLFSLGVVLYELLTGEKPFPGDQISTVIYRVLHEEPRPPSRIQRSLPPVFDSLLARALHKDPDLRFQTAAEFAGVLRDPAAFQASRPPAPPTRISPAPAVARPASPAAASRAPAPRARGGLLKGAVLSLVALALAGFVTATFVPSLRRVLRREALPKLLSMVPARLGGHGGGPPPLQLASDEEGVDFTLDGRPLGADLPAWDPSLAGARLEATDGCRRGVRTLPGAPPDGPFRVPLTEPVRRPVRIETVPPGAAAVVDTRPLEGPTPASLELEACAPHEIGLELPGFAPATLSLPPGGDWEALARPVRLERLPEGIVRWEIPYALAIFEGERRLGNTSAPLSLPPGAHRLTLRNVDHRVELSQEIRVEPGGRQTLRPQVPGLGAVRINAYPGNAEIVVDGIEAGPPPLQMSLGAGEHRIGVRWKMGEPEESSRSVTVLSGAGNPPVNFKQGA